MIGDAVEVAGHPVGPPETPSGVFAVGGKNALMVLWEPPAEGTIHDAYVLQWRTRGEYEEGDEVVVGRPGARSHLLDDMAGHGRYYVRVVARNMHGRSEPSEEYFVMSGAPGAPTDFKVEIPARRRVRADMGPAGPVLSGQRELPTGARQKQETNP